HELSAISSLNLKHSCPLWFRQIEANYENCAFAEFFSECSLACLPPLPAKKERLNSVYDLYGFRHNNY
ncbi:MAG: hypothetical protein WAV78_31490, partial [Xanthobacteraceae bacterium]